MPGWGTKILHAMWCSQKLGGYQFKSKNRHLVCRLQACDYEQCLLL